MLKQICAFANCSKPIMAKGLCPGHYTQQLRGKNLRPLGPMKNLGYRWGQLTIRVAGRLRPEYRTVQNHWHCIFQNPEKHPTYNGMPFEETWNPQQGGRLIIGMHWIIQNLGYRVDWAKEQGIPDNQVSLHIQNQALGFVPGNLAWATTKTQHSEKMRGVISKQNSHIRRLQKEIEYLRRLVPPEKQYKSTIDNEQEILHTDIS